MPAVKVKVPTDDEKFTALRNEAFRAKAAAKNLSDYHEVWQEYLNERARRLKAGLDGNG